MTKPVVRPVLWLLFALALTGNIATSGSAIAVNLAFGLLTLAFGAALAVHHYRYRRSH